MNGARQWLTAGPLTQLIRCGGGDSFDFPGLSLCFVSFFIYLDFSARPPGVARCPSTSRLRAGFGPRLIDRDGGNGELGNWVDGVGRERERERENSSALSSWRGNAAEGPTPIKVAHRAEWQRWADSRADLIDCVTNSNASSIPSHSRTFGLFYFLFPSTSTITNPITAM